MIASLTLFCTFSAIYKGVTLPFITLVRNKITLFTHVFQPWDDTKNSLSQFQKSIFLKSSSISQADSISILNANIGFSLIPHQSAMLSSMGSKDIQFVPIAIVSFSASISFIRITPT